MSNPQTGPKITVALIQMSCTDRPEANLEKALDRIGEAAARGAQVVCLQELFRTCYFCQSESDEAFDLAEPIPGPTTDALGRAAAKHHVTLIGSVFEKRAAGIFHNTAVVLGEDGCLRGRYRKMHIPDDPLYYEKFYFTPGDLGFQSFPAGPARIGTLVCWDQWFPEAARLTALAGAQVLFYPTAIGWFAGGPASECRAMHQAWETVQRGHAIANGVFVAAANRVGREGGLEFWGASFVCDPFGEVIARASHDREEILVACCDLGRVDQTRRQWPFFRDRRIDAYGGILERFNDRPGGDS
ncbi:MAG: carbon-nitrogen hydrolase [Planctomycetes bacterium]|nr:carbon-nitrogen hydrolase [Planctomycetota bacterium]